MWINKYKRIFHFVQQRINLVDDLKRSYWWPTSIYSTSDCRERLVEKRFEIIDLSNTWRGIYRKFFYYFYYPTNTNSPSGSICIIFRARNFIKMICRGDEYRSNFFYFRSRSRGNMFQRVDRFYHLCDVDDKKNWVVKIFGDTRVFTEAGNFDHNSLDSAC